MNLARAIDDFLELQKEIAEKFSEKDHDKDIMNYKSQKVQYLKGLSTAKFKQILSEIKQMSFDYNDLVDDFRKLNEMDSDGNVGAILLEVKEKVKSIPAKKGLKIPKNIPGIIHDEVLSDIKEMEKCFEARCFRAATIICGRLLEASLHRKYYEVTGTDILEKNPGIGLGTLVAKLKAKDVVFDPGITQQIHLVNQVRIFSVHKKQELFYPTREQAYAIMLYTLEILNSMFKKK